jgi:DNA adenine methylase
MKSPIKWHGGKYYLARKIVERMPAHLHYVEPYAGSLAVLFEKEPEGVSEVVNDLDGELANFWRVLRHEETFSRFVRLSQATPLSEHLWRECYQEDDERDDVEKAWAFFVKCRMSFSGRQREFSGITKKRTRRGMNAETSAWLSSVEGLDAVHARLKRVLILSRDALDVIRGQDGEGTLFYLDPPYLQETRTAKSVYRHEMSEAQHREMLSSIRACKGGVMISGYRSGLYDDALQGWTRHDFEMANHASSSDVKRRMTECLWVNR